MRRSVKSKWLLLPLAVILGRGVTKPANADLWPRAAASTTSRNGIATAHSRLPVSSVSEERAAGYALNVKAFGASGSTFSASAQTRSGESSITVNSAGDFAVGQPVQLLGMGGLASTSPPMGLAVQAMTYSRTGIVDKTGCNVDRANPSCSTPWTFQLVAVDFRNGYSGPSAPATVQNGPANPNVTNRILLSWPGDARAAGYLVYGAPAGQEPSLLAVLPLMYYGPAPGAACASCSAPHRQVYYYMGHRFGSSEVLGTRRPVVQGRQSLFTVIRSIDRNRIVLRDPPQVTASGVIITHDDSAAIQAAIGSAERNRHTASSNGTPIFVPPGTYPIGQTLRFDSLSNIRFYGGGGEGESHMTQFVWHGPAGGIMCSLNGTRDVLFENLSFTDNGGGARAGSTPGVMLDIDNYGPGAQGGKHNLFRNLGLDRSGIAVRIGDRSRANAEMNHFEHVVISSPVYGLQAGGWMGYYISGNWQTYDESIVDSMILNRRDFAVYLDGAGSLNISILNYEHNLIDIYLNSALGPGQGHVVESAVDSEGASQHLYVSLFGNPQRVAIYDSRLVTDPQEIASTDEYIVDNASRGLELAGNTITAGAARPCKILFSQGTVASLISLSNVYGYSQPFDTLAGRTPEILSIGDSITVPGGLRPSAAIIPNCNEATGLLLRQR